MAEKMTMKRKRNSDLDSLQEQPAAKRVRPSASPVRGQPTITDNKSSVTESSKQPTTVSKHAKKPVGPSPHKHQIKGPLKPKPNITKLAPVRPYPTVPTSSSATGPRSKRKEGNNKICVSRKTPLAAYLHQCRDVFLKQGYKELYISSMGAAIPHAAMLATSLPAILPYDRRELKTTITTGTVNVVDDVLPLDEDDEGSMKTRAKASVEIIIRLVPIEVTTQDTD